MMLGGIVPASLEGRAAPSQCVSAQDAGAVRVADGSLVAWLASERRLPHHCQQTATVFLLHTYRQWSDMVKLQLFNLEYFLNK